MRSFGTRDGIHLCCISRWILYHGFTREARSLSSVPLPGTPFPNLGGSFHLTTHSGPPALPIFIQSFDKHTVSNYVVPDPITGRGDEGRAGSCPDRKQGGKQITLERDMKDEEISV